MRFLCFALLALSIPMVAQEPIKVTSEDQVKLLKIMRNSEKALADRQAAINSFTTANSTYQSLQDQFSKLLAELSKKYKCDGCALNTETLEFTPEPKKAEPVKPEPAKK